MLHWWKTLFREYFTFHFGERRGAFILLGLIIVVLFLPAIARWTIIKKPIDFSLFKNEIDSFESQFSLSDSTSDAPTIYDLDREKRSAASQTAKVELFNFDPNTASEDDFYRLGLSNRTTKTILNYREKGGKFFKKEDFKKIYGLKTEDYNRLEPFIAINSIQETSGGITKSDSKPKEDHVAESSLVDINLADSIQLVSLPMIGPVLSSRIIKYRTKLGGFYSVQQLNEVYGLKPETLSAIETKIIINLSEIEKININDVTVNDLKQHPYFKSIAVPVISYREQHGNYQSPNDLLNVDVIDQGLLDKITPYLIFQ